jgi:CCR4-NOT transcriptional regulation complex NOT5 subunit
MKKDLNTFKELKKKVMKEMSKMSKRKSLLTIKKIINSKETETKITHTIESQVLEEEEETLERMDSEEADGKTERDTKIPLLKREN